MSYVSALFDADSPMFAELSAFRTRKLPFNVALQEF